MKLRVNSNPPKPISPELLEKLAADGVELKAMGKHFGLAYTTLWRRIDASLTLKTAYQNGRKRRLETVRAETETV